MQNAPYLLLSFASLSVFALGVIFTNLWVKQRAGKLVRARLNSILGLPAAQTAQAPLSPRKFTLPDFHGLTQFQFLQALVERSGIPIKSDQLLCLAAVLFAAPPLVAFALGLPFELAFVAGMLLCALPFAFVFTKAEQCRTRFTEQLPDAIDLMVSILRSGLSVLQSVKSVAEESPAPCGDEFSEVLHRLNLGQSLPDALAYSVKRFNSFELDLIRRATAIQLEVGGSLAELLDKTNSTLRQRLKLKRHVRVLTAQSRLSGLIIGLMPFFVAGAFEMMRPGYLRPLMETNIGRIFLSSALLLQVTGVILIKKLSTFKV